MWKVCLFYLVVRSPGCFSLIQGCWPAGQATSWPRGSRSFSRVSWQYRYCCAPTASCFWSSSSSSFEVACWLFSTFQFALYLLSWGSFNGYIIATAISCQHLWCPWRLNGRFSNRLGSETLNQQVLWDSRPCCHKNFHPLYRTDCRRQGGTWAAKTKYFAFWKCW